MDSTTHTPSTRQRSVHTITDRFSMRNTYLIVEERCIVVDPGSDQNIYLLQEYLQNFLHRSINDIDLVVLTHLHPDHTAGIHAFRHLSKAPIAASIVAQQLAERSMKHSLSPTLSKLTEKMLPGALQHLDLFLPAYHSQVKYIDLWLQDVEGLPGHLDWRVLASPGHTPDSLCLYNPFTLELLCGDTMITIPGGAPLLRGNTNHLQLEETIRMLKSLNVHYLYPGHGRAILGQRPLQNIDVEW